MWMLLDSNESLTIKFHELEAQNNNGFIKFNLVKDFCQHLFCFNLTEENMMQGFTPFCLQRMEQLFENRPTATLEESCIPPWCLPI